MKRNVLFLILLLTATEFVFGQNEAQYVAEMTVKLKAPGGNYKSSCSNYFNIKLYDLNNAQVTAWSQDIEAAEKTYRKTLTGINAIKTVTIAAKRQYSEYFGLSCKTADGSTDNPDNYTFTMSGATTQSVFSIPGWGSTSDNSLTLLLYPKQISITTNNPSYDNPAVPTYSFPTEDKITLSATSGYHTATYQWQYSFDLAIWTNLPAAYNGQTQISICGQDLFGNNALQRVKDNKNISFRIKPPHTNTNSEIITLDMVPSAPHIIGAQVKNASCFNGDDGAVTLLFDRDMIPGERLCVYVWIGANDNYLDQCVESLNNRSLQVSDLSSGDQPTGITYTFDLLGYYRNVAASYEHTTFTGAVNHKRTATVAHPAEVSFSLTAITDALCYEEDNGSFQVDASGGTPPYALMWKKEEASGYTVLPFSSGSVVCTDLKAGVYEFYVSDSKNCYVRDAAGDPLTRQVTLTQPSTAVNIEDYQAIQPSGYGLSNGALAVEVSGGTGSYNGSWKNSYGQTLGTVSQETSLNGVVYTLHSIPAGIYTFTVFDSNGCEQEKVCTLNQPAQLTVSIQETTAIQCKGESNGALAATAAGGVPGSGYLYQWYKKTAGGTYTLLLSENNPTLGAVGVGEYKVVVTDNSLISNTAEAIYNLQEPAEVTCVSLQVQPVTCYGHNDGSVRITAQGGNGNYTVAYKKDGSASYSEASSGASNVITINNLTKGDYTFSLRDQNGCFAPRSGGNDAIFTVTEPATSLEIEPVDHKNVSGFGRSDGSVSYRIKGGTPNSVSPPSYTVQWKNRQGALLTPVNTVTNGFFVTRIENIPQGIYTLEVMDRNYSASAQNACYATVTMAVTEPEPLTVGIVSTVSIDCHGETSGKLVARIRGGIPFTGSHTDSYQIRWYKIENGQDLLCASGSDSILSGAGAGDYKVYVEDASNPVNQVTSAVFHLAEPPLLIASRITTADVSCHGLNNGYIHIDVSGGVGRYKLFCKRKSMGETYQEYPVHANGFSFHLDNLFADTFTVYVVDGNGCYARMDHRPTAGEVEIVITQPDKPLEAQLYQLKNTSGFGRADGLIACRIEGGTPISASPPSYHASWFDDQGNPVAGTDRIIDGYFVTQLQNLPQGFYTLQVTDKNYVPGAQNTCFFTKIIEVAEPEPLTVNLVNTSTVDCFGETTGAFAARVRGGVPNIAPGVMPYTFRWYKVENGRDILLNDRTDSVIFGLGTGYYKVYIEDGSDPVNTVQSPVFHITEPPQLLTTLTTGDISCCNMNDGFIHLTVTGGVGRYRLFYKGTGTNGVYRQHPVQADGHTFRLDSLFSDVYSVYILDDNNCYAAIEGDEIHDISLGQPDAPLGLSSVSLHHVSAFGQRNGHIEVVIEGGTIFDDNTYAVVWKNESGEQLPATAFIRNGRYGSSIDGLNKGEYTITVTDKNYTAASPGKEATCFYTGEFVITEPEEFIGKIEEHQVISCHGMPDGQLVAHVTGGAANQAAGNLPYRYTWYRETDGVYQALPNETDSVLGNIPAGKYRVEVRDYSWLENKFTEDYTLLQPDPLIAVATDTSVTCGQTVDIVVSVSGGTPPYRYEWSTGDDTPSVAGAVAGKYVVFVNDARGCQTIATARVMAPSDLAIESVLADPLCWHGTNGRIELSVTGGEPPYRYRWNTGAASKDLTNVPAGAYSVVVTDRGDCSVFQSFVLSEPEAVRLDLGEDRTLCAGQSVEIKPVVDDPATQFEWTGPGGFHSAAPAVLADREGVYRLTTTNSNGCQATDELYITVKDLAISSEIVVASQVFAGDTVVVVNISNPNPASVDWLIEASDSLEIVEQSDHQASVIFKYPGSYPIGLRSYVGDCFRDNIKTVTVMNPHDRTSDFPGESLIEKFVVYPSPSNGTFQVEVKLTKEAPVRLRIVNTGSGIVFGDTRYQGDKDYSIPYRTTFPAGVYAVLLETASGQTTVKIIIK
jgi:hypothetical protein